MGDCPHDNWPPGKQIPPKEYYKWTEENYALSTSTIIKVILIFQGCKLGVKSDLLPYTFDRF